MKTFFKKIIKSLPIDFTQNQKYDRLTQQVIAKVCKPESNCVDVGCHKGEVMDHILEAAPNGTHFGFEPIPDLYQGLIELYKDKDVKVYDVALSDSIGSTTFNYVISNPSYSGLQKRNYDRPQEEDTTIEVRMDKLDHIVQDTPIDLIKIDVEGGELGVLKGATNILKRDQPVVVFEHGLGASDIYGTYPKQIFELFDSCGMKVSLMDRWIKGQEPLDLPAFEEQFYKKINYYFIAYSG
ncbi:MAG: FkbM family methyltransferase [Bacteroidia bacterium]